MSNIVLNLFRYFEYIVSQKKKYAKIGDIDHNSSHTNSLSFQ